MRLLFISDTEKTTYSGMGRWTFHICKELRSTGHSVDEWYSNDLPRLQSKLLQHFLVPTVIAYRVWRLRKRYDVAFVHEPSAWAAAILAQLFPSSMPTIVAVSHGVETHAKAEYSDASEMGFYRYTVVDKIKHKLFRNWLSDLGLTQAAKVICLSSSDAKYLQHALDVYPRNIVQIDNGIDPVVDIPKVRDVIQDPNQVIMLSAWREYKGIKLLPIIWDRVRAKCPLAKLLLVGTGADKSEVLATFSPEARPSVDVYPSVHDREEMQKILSSASIFFMPSLFEGSPLSMVEAMACGLAVVGSNAGGIPDLLSNGTYGRVFPWRQPEVGADMLIDLLMDPSERVRLSHLARQRALALTWQASALPIQAMLEQMETRS